MLGLRDRGGGAGEAVTGAGVLQEAAKGLGKAGRRAGLGH
jgi:hypothetical protein